MLKFAGRLLPWAVALGLLVGAGEQLPAQAEGSRSLFPTNTGFRANLEWRTGFYLGQLRRRTLLRVFARQNEAILLGSSTIGVNNGDILVFNPNLVPFNPVGNVPIPGNPSFRCSDQRAVTNNPTQGVISNRTQELAGPDTFPGGGVPNGYTPCFYTAPETGIYTVVILGPAGDNSNSETAPTGNLDSIQTGADQNTSVAAWDVTVRSDLTSPIDLLGRLFTFYLSLFTGANNRPISSTIFALTTDGYLYQTGLNGVDPNGFAAYGNRTGFLDSDGVTPLNRDLVATNDELSDPAGGITIPLPEFPLFFNRPDPGAIAALGIPLAPVAPEVTANSFQFNGNLGANNTLVQSGGNFVYSANVDHVYELVISRDGINFDPTAPQNRVLRGSRSRGAATIAWDGLDNVGTPFPVGNNYQSRLVVRTGEYHFPLLDVENSTLGSPFYELLNPPGPNCLRGLSGRCTIAFYDDRGYRTSNGSSVGTLNQALPNAPNPPNSDLVNGFDSSPPSSRAFTGFGDKKGLDLWIYYPSAAVITPLNVLEQGTADLRLTKTVDNPAATVGQTVTFTLTLTNAGPANATRVAVLDLLPAGLGFVAATPSQGAYDPATGLWTLDTIAARSVATLSIRATLVGNGAVSNTAQVISSDQPDPNSTPNNNNPSENDQATATIGAPNLRLTKRVTGITRSGVPIAFSNFVDDPSDPNDTAPGWAQFSPVGVPTIPNGEPLQSGDEIEYTVYFLSDGSQPTIDVTLCDQIPRGTSLVSDRPLVRRGTGLPGLEGAVFSPLAPLPTGNTCADSRNPFGSVLVNLGDVSSTPGSNFGFVRFRVRVE
ncbi:MAG TPA: DUF11 domain-containing protein [Thermosynechococcaceae cyanobacterium]